MHAPVSAPPLEQLLADEWAAELPAAERASDATRTRNSLGDTSPKQVHRQTCLALAALQQLLCSHCLRAWRNQRRRAWRAALRKRRAGRASKKRASRCRRVAALISQAMLAHGTLCTSLVCLQSMQRRLSILQS